MVQVGVVEGIAFNEEARPSRLQQRRFPAAADAELLRANAHARNAAQMAQKNMGREHRIVAGFAHFQAEIDISVEQGELLAETAHLLKGATAKHHAIARNRRNVLRHHSAVKIALAFRIHMAEQRRYHA